MQLNRVVTKIDDFPSGGKKRSSCGMPWRRMAALYQEVRKNQHDVHWKSTRPKELHRCSQYGSQEFTVGRSMK